MVFVLSKECLIPYLVYLSNRFTILAVSVQSETIIFTLNIGCPQQEV